MIRCGQDSTTSSQPGRPACPPAPIIAAAWRIRSEVTGEWILALAGIARIVVGAIVLFMPVIGAVLTVAIVATWAILGGITALALGFRLRQLDQRIGTAATGSA